MLNNIGLPGIILILIVFGLVIRSFRRSTSQNEERAVTNPPVTETNSGQIEKTIISGKCHVIDGDTIAIKKQKIRLSGINAPEFNEPYGKQAKWAMVEVCKGCGYTRGHLFPIKHSSKSLQSYRNYKISYQDDTYQSLHNYLFLKRSNVIILN